jgi:hypothetical protein
MAYDIKNLSFSLIASSSYTTSQYKAVFASTATEGNFVILGTTIGHRNAVGILQNNPGNGDAGEIWPQGCISKIIAGSSINVGKNFFIRGNGLAYSTQTIPSARSIMYGPVLETAASSSDIITVSFASLGITT